MKRFAIGVDAGGTKTEAWIAEWDQPMDAPLLGKGQAGAGNLLSVGFDSATHNIKAAIRAALPVASGQIHSLCLSAAGAGRDDEQQQLRTWLQSEFQPDRILITSDAEAVLAAACPERIGIALIAGTGSLAWGRNHLAETDRSGGWGYLFGDEGSAFDIGRKALQFVSQVADGRQDGHSLLPAILHALNLRKAEQLIPEIYRSRQPRQTIASLAPHVFACQAAGDPTAENIIDTCAEDLGRMVKAVASKLNLPDNYVLAMTGGVLLHQTAYRRCVQRCLQRRQDATIIVKHPAQGALNIARTAGN